MLKIPGILKKAGELYNKKNSTYDTFRNRIFKQLLLKFPNRELSKGNHTSLVYLAVKLHANVEEDHLKFGNQFVGIEKVTLEYLQSTPLVKIKSISDIDVLDDNIEIASPLFKTINVTATSIVTKAIAKLNRFYSLKEVIIYTNIIAKLCTMFFGLILPDRKLQTKDWLYGIEYLIETPALKYSDRIATLPPSLITLELPSEEDISNFQSNDATGEILSLKDNLKNKSSAYIRAMVDKIFEQIVEHPAPTEIEQSFHESYSLFSSEIAGSVNLSPTLFIQYISNNDLLDITNVDMFTGDSYTLEMKTNISRILEKILGFFRKTETEINRTIIKLSRVIVYRDVYDNEVNWYILALQSTLSMRNEPRNVLSIFNLSDKNKNIWPHIINDSIELIRQSYTKYLHKKKVGATLKSYPSKIMIPMKYTVGNRTKISIGYGVKLIPSSSIPIYRDYPVISSPQMSEKLIDGAILNYIYNLFAKRSVVGKVFEATLIKKYIYPKILLDYIKAGKFSNIYTMLKIQSMYETIDSQLLNFVYGITRMIDLIHTTESYKYMSNIAMLEASAEKDPSNPHIRLETKILNKSGKEITVYFYFTLSSTAVKSAVLIADLTDSRFAISIPTAAGGEIIKYKSDEFIIFANVSSPASLKEIKVYSMTKFTMNKDMYQSVEIQRIIHPEENTKIIASIKDNDPMIILEMFKINDLIRILDKKTNTVTYRFIRPRDIPVQSWESEIKMPKDMIYRNEVSNGENSDQAIDSSGEL